MRSKVKSIGLVVLGAVAGILVSLNIPAIADRSAQAPLPLDELRAAGREVVAFRSRNLFFGGVQAVERAPATGALSGGGDPRRGGVAVAVDVLEHVAADDAPERRVGQRERAAHHDRERHRSQKVRGEDDQGGLHRAAILTSRPL